MAILEITTNLAIIKLRLDNLTTCITYINSLSARIFSGILCNQINNNLKKIVKSLSNVYLLSVYMSSSLTLNLQQYITENIKAFCVVFR